MNTIRNIVVAVILLMGVFLGGLTYMGGLGTDYGTQLEDTPLNQSNVSNRLTNLTFRMRSEMQQATPDTTGELEFATSITTGAFNSIRLFWDFTSILAELTTLAFETQGILIPQWFLFMIYGLIEAWMGLTIFYIIIFRND